MLPLSGFARPKGINVSIKSRILGILGVLACGYLLLLTIVQLTASATHNRIERVSTTLFPAALSLGKAKASFEQLKRHSKDAVMLEDPGALVVADQDAADVALALRNLRRDLDASPELIPEIVDLTQQFASIRARSHDTYAAMLAGKENVDLGVQTQVGVLAIENEKLTDHMQALDSDIAAQFKEQLAQIDSWSNRSRIIGRVMLLIALMGCFGAWWILQYQVIVPLEQLKCRMQDIAEGDGDLTDRVVVNGHNELDEVGYWFNVFIERIEQIVLRVTQNAHSLDDAAQAMAKLVHESTSHATLQHQHADNITSNMGEISTAVKEISRTAQDAARDSRKAEQDAHAGGQTIHSTVATIQQMLVANQATATKVEELGGATQAIGKVISVIDDIASQTNLLALNASIESARAGEHGRGFAVVAAEVRRLAERTSNATREIDQTVRAIQDGTLEVVEAMRSSMHRVQSGVSSARSAGEALANIIQGSESMQKMVTQIAVASTEQSAATLSVNRSLDEIADLRAKRSNSSAEAVAACSLLTALADDLNHLVGSFKVRPLQGSL